MVKINNKTSPSMNGLPPISEMPTENLIIMAEGTKKDVEMKLKKIEHTQLSQEEIGKLGQIITVYNKIDKTLKQRGEKPLLQSTITKLQNELDKQEKKLTDSIYSKVFVSNTSASNQTAYLKATNMIQERILSGKKQAMSELKKYGF